MGYKGASINDVASFSAFFDHPSPFLPIISFNTRGGDELVIDDLNGFIVDNFDFEFYAEKILSFKNFEINPNDPKIKEHLLKYGLTENTKKIINCYNNLLDKN